MSPRRAVAVIAAVVLAVGVVLAVTSLSIGRGSDEMGCGSALDPSYVQADVRDAVDPPLLGSYVAACEDVVSDRRWVAYPVGGAGALVLLFLWLTGQHTTRWDADEDESADVRTV